MYNMPNEFEIEIGDGSLVDIAVDIFLVVESISGVGNSHDDKCSKSWPSR